MNGTKKNRNRRFKLKKPVTIQHASSKDVANATIEVIREHSHTIELLAKA
jgi:hypothetical protein